MESTTARWAEVAASQDREAPSNFTAKFTTCTSCQVSTRKGVDTERHAASHADEAKAERARRGDRVVRVAG